jgi:Tol biopolymer transport system component
MKLRHIIWFLMLMLPTVVMAQDSTDTPDGGLARSDAGQILFVQDGYLHMMDGDGSNERQLSNISGIAVAAWMPDGNEIVMAIGVSLYLINADGSDSHLLCVLSGDYYTVSIAPSPDGAWVLWSIEYRGDVTRQSFYLVDAAAGDITPLAEHTSFDQAYSWSPDGSKILFNVDTDIQARDIDSGEDRVFAQGISAAWSPDGTTIAVVNPRESDVGEFSTLNLLSPNGVEIRQVIERQGLMRVLHWSPDGRYIAYFIDHDIEGTVLMVTSAQIVDVETGDAYFVTPTYLHGNITLLAWSPDGQQLTFNFSDTSGILLNSTLYSINPEDIELVPLFAECECELSSLSWRP